jgi:hypothetical protein
MPKAGKSAGVSPESEVIVFFSFDEGVLEVGGINVKCFILFDFWGMGCKFGEAPLW